MNNFKQEGESVILNNSNMIDFSDTYFGSTNNSIIIMGREGEITGGTTGGAQPLTNFRTPIGDSISILLVLSALYALFMVKWRRDKKRIV